MKKYLINISIGLIICFLLIAMNEKKGKDLGENDKKEIIQVVVNYYEALETEDFYQALSYCYFTDSNNDLNMDLESRVVSLTEIWKNIIVNFETEGIRTEVNYDSREKSYSVTSACGLQYIDTRGAAINEIVYVRKIDGAWKIWKLYTSDRYAAFRTGKIKYGVLMELLRIEE